MNAFCVSLPLHWINTPLLTMRKNVAVLSIRKKPLKQRRQQANGKRPDPIRDRSQSGRHTQKILPLQKERYQVHRLQRRKLPFKFVNDQGKVLPRRLTGTSLKFQRKVAQAVKRAPHRFASLCNRFFKIIRRFKQWKLF